MPSPNSSIPIQYYQIRINNKTAPLDTAVLSAHLTKVKSSSCLQTNYIVGKGKLWDKQTGIDSEENKLKAISYHKLHKAVACIQVWPQVSNT